jgi:hypothetical protein
VEKVLIDDLVRGRGCFVAVSGDGTLQLFKQHRTANGLGKADYGPLRLGPDAFVPCYG